MKVSVIIPTLNEEESIGHVLDKIPRDPKYEWEIMIVDGDSKDKTREIAENKGARVIIEKRKGYGRAYKTGFAAATGDIIVTLDGDDTYPAEKIPALVDYLLKNDLDFISCERFSKMQKGAMSATHKFGNWVLTITTRILFGVKIKDSQSGMWVFRKEILKDLNLTSDGMPFSEEIKIEAWRKFKCEEVPIEYRERKGEVKLNTWRDGLKNLKFLFKKRFKR
ncbi:glycosyltransferase family 2 protein [Candidatus Aciduliprofundum boonei]|uniref:Glycosyl transferase family 2 n=1 Tax=Aciduliprofundum boonei (strain DSM 19572 / T469) TaxID=439481 RepID=B5IA34_ACIB4|nr:glycosyltransferase family 2 protein [Candidatus Aciduliprofundum boonei]ADD08331.1 glycosyl transferase family 2 [Aciduliprofundum boonei T469]EDY36684.1 glycosyl transferase, group 2 family protein, putative [Aciduliprofundum boonei T469]HII54675.1 glycosyltransferase family 2 protein [Candidatus Aciduliprofundum boonei]